MRKPAKPTGRDEVLGTDGFGRSDDRENLRRFFEVDAHFISYAASAALAREDKIPISQVADVSKQDDIDTEKRSPLLT